MIRPVTCVCFLLACGAGLYLYQAKHRVNLIDQQIEKTVRSTEATREQIRLLHAEWTRLNQPDRLQQLADQFLDLKATNPSQFTSMAELDARLPPVLPPQTVPAPSPPSEVPVASAVPAQPPPALAEAEAPPAHRDPVGHPPADTARPIPRIMPAASTVAPAQRPAPSIVRVRPAVIEAAAHSRWPPHPLPSAAPPQPPERASGSLLGMAHAAVSPAPPAPMPIYQAVGPNGN